MAKLGLVVTAPSGTYDWMVTEMLEGEILEGRADLLDFARTEGYTGQNDVRKIVSFLNESVAEDGFVFIYTVDALFYYDEPYVKDVMLP